MSITAALKAITLGSLITYGSTIGTVVTGGYWGLNWMIKQAVADEKYATQEALDAQRRVLEGLQGQFHTFMLDQTKVQTDIGTLKQFNTEGIARDQEAQRTLNQILLGIGQIKRNVSPN